MSTDTAPEAQTNAIPEEGYFPRWKLKAAGIVMPDERLPWDQTLFAGLQHGVAMAGGTIIAPLIIGFDPNLALLFSGVGIFFVVVAGRVPSYLGSSFSFVFAVAAIVSILLGFSPKFGALILSIPAPVLSGLSVVLFGLIATMAGRIWVENRVDFSNPRNMITVAVALTAGAGDLTLRFGGFTMGGIGTATFGRHHPLSNPGLGQHRRITLCGPRASHRALGNRAHNCGSMPTNPAHLICG